ncbi:DEAD/DEAH box helicase [Catenulispora subtropica]|uniref:AAA+ ATPase domain-containing protein n=1 Tax=Catenulispora subtropica TaxID=450798 RepID=A0ABN2QS50_9ACTN
MAERQARIPEHWHRWWIARAAQADPAGSVTLELTMSERGKLAQKLDNARCTGEDIALDLEMITSFRRRPVTARYPDPAYEIKTPSYWLLAANVDWDGVSGVAQVVDLGRHRIPDMNPLISPLVRGRLYSAREPVAFDLASALRAYEESVIAAKAYAAEAAYGNAPSTPRAARLAALDRRLLPALALLSLIEKRDEVAAATTVRGTLDAAGSAHAPGERPEAADFVRIRLDEANAAFVEDTDVMVDFRDGSPPIPAEVADVQGRDLAVRPRSATDVENLEAREGPLWVIRQAKPRIKWAANNAINRARTGAVVGDWDMLTRLVIDPAKLPQVRVDATECPGSAIGSRLSAEQETAVRRAVEARHAFFIQGPPGTGKTTVIAEIVRRLVRRGERILLAAPMHVAVDEVLSKVREDPAVWPMRVAAESKNIRPAFADLREDALAASVARRLKQTVTSSEDPWSEEEKLIAHRVELLIGLRTAQRLHSAASQRLLREALEEVVAELEARLAAISEDEAKYRTLVNAADAADREWGQEEHALDAQITAALDHLRSIDRRLSDAQSVSQQAAAGLAESERQQNQAQDRLNSLTAKMAAARAAIAQASTVIARMEKEAELAARRQESARNALAGLYAEAESRQEAANHASHIVVKSERSSGAIKLWFADRGRGQLSRLRAEHRRAQEQAARAFAKAAASEKKIGKADSKLRSQQAEITEQRRILQQQQIQILGEDADHQAASTEAQRWTDRVADDRARMHAAETQATELRHERDAAREQADQLAARRSIVRGRRTRARRRSELERGLVAKAEEEGRDTAAELAATRTRLVQLKEDVAAKRQLLEQARATALPLLGEVLPADLDRAVDEATGRRARIASLRALRQRWRELLGADREESGSLEDRLDQFGRIAVDATNLVCTTTAGIAGSPSARDADFDTLILDEASRVVDVDFLIPAVRARRWILVGDEHQLPPYVDQEVEQHVHAMLALDHLEHTASAPPSDTDPLDAAISWVAASHAQAAPTRPIRVAPTTSIARALLEDGSWDAHYRQHLADTLARLEDGLSGVQGGTDPEPIAALISELAIGQAVSRFERCVTVPEADRLVSRMTIQRRMVPSIAALVNEPVYDGRYQSPHPEELERLGIAAFTGPRYPAPLAFYDTGRSSRSERLVGTGFVNDFEADLVVKILRMWDDMATASNQTAPPTYSVLSFYKAQASLIDRRLRRTPLTRLQRGVVNAIDKIQGQESDLVIISFVRALRDRRGRPRRPGPGTLMWLQDLHRLNVAVTRARRALALVGDRPTLEALRGDDSAVRFYRNLFSLLDDGAEGTVYVPDSAL